MESLVLREQAMRIERENSYPKRANYLVIDPGLKNTASVLMTITQESQDERPNVYLLKVVMGNMEGEVNPDKDLANVYFRKVMDEVKGMVDPPFSIIVEFQPPLNTLRNPALVRWNSWVEAYAVCFFQGVVWGRLAHKVAPVHYVHSNGVKGFFEVRAKDYHLNKMMSIRKANEYIVGEKAQTDHVSDCVLMGLFYFLNKE